MSYIVGFALLFLVANNIHSIQALNKLMTTMALNGWLIMVAGTGTILIKGFTPGTRLKMLDMNENEVGILALITMIGVLWQVLQPISRHIRIKKLLTLIFLLMTIVLVAASGSRGSATSLFVTLLAFCFWKPTRKWGLFGLMDLSLGLIFVPFLFTTTLERFAIMTGDTMLGGREVLWQATWNMILDQPWLGVGIGNARHELVSYVMPLIGVRAGISVATHNPILQVWAETGLPGILLYLGILGSAVWLFERQHYYYRKLRMQVMFPYLALVSSTFLGYMASWFKGGGMEASFPYFLTISLLLIPACLDFKDSGTTPNSIGININDSHIK